MPYIRVYKHFNPRSREGSDQERAFKFAAIKISIHAPARGATTWNEALTYLGIISIHAPARGATMQEAAMRRRRAISIHAPARGATAMPRGASTYSSRFQSTLPRGERPDRHPQDGQSQHFNPRSREGSDRLQGKSINQICISIHAPARGATTKPSKKAGYKIFQSTLPRGERPRNRCRQKWTSYFNPRSREGSDWTRQ